jgi:hypothetical protein
MTVKVAHAHVQRLVSVVKIAMVLQEYDTEEQRSAVQSLWAIELNAKDIPKEIFCVYGGKDIHKEIFCVSGGKCLSRNAVHSWVANLR